MSWLDIGRSLLELLAPSVCPGCDLPLNGPGEAGFCGACAPLLEAAPSSLAPPADIAAAFVYGGPLADAICRLKYGGRTDLAPALGALLSRAARPYVGRVDLVLPIPLHPRRLRARGFNQAALLAKPVARDLGVPLDVSTLARIRHTVEQAGISRVDRACNVKGAFRARPLGRPARTLLIDDVRTTGATLAAASEALLEAGFANVYALALASARP